MQREEVKKLIHKDLDNNDMLNIFGLVSVGAVRSRVQGCEPYTDKEMKAMIRELFGDETINGVQFTDKN